MRSSCDLEWSWEGKIRKIIGLRIYLMGLRGSRRDFRISGVWVILLLIQLSRTNKLCSTRSDSHRKGCGSCCRNGRRRQSSREILDFGTVGHRKTRKRWVERLRVGKSNRSRNDVVCLCQGLEDPLAHRYGGLLICIFRINTWLVITPDVELSLTVPANQPHSPDRIAHYTCQRQCKICAAWGSMHRESYKACRLWIKVSAYHLSPQ